MCPDAQTRNPQHSYPCIRRHVQFINRVDSLSYTPGVCLLLSPFWPRLPSPFLLQRTRGLPNWALRILEARPHLLPPYQVLCSEHSICYHDGRLFEKTFQALSKWESFEQIPGQARQSLTILSLSLCMDFIVLSLSWVPSKTYLYFKALHTRLTFSWAFVCNLP